MSRSRIESLLLAAVAALSASCTSTPNVNVESRVELWAFTAPWDPRSARSVTAHAAALDVVVSGWYSLDTITARPAALYADSIPKRLGGSTRAYALVTSFAGDAFHPMTIRLLAQDTARRGAVAGDLARQLARGGYRGAVLDFESLAPNDLDALIAVSRAMRDSLHAHDLASVSLAVPAGDTLAYPSGPLLGAVDALVVMLYDQHWANSPPGPIAAPDWARQLLQQRIADVGTERIVAAFPVYGYAWRPGASDVVSFADAQRLAGERGLLLARDPGSATLYAAQVSPKEPWATWVSDAVLLDSLVRDARPLGVHRFALWRLGLEDPSTWQKIARWGGR